VVSRTTTVWLHEALLPQSSVAVQVRVCVPVPEQVPGANESLNVTVGFASQLSVTVGAGKTGVAGHSIGDVAGAQVIVGFAVSFTVTVFVQVLLQPAALVTCRVSVKLAPHVLPAVTVTDSP